MELLLKDHVMREIQEDRETSLRCYEDKPTRDIVNFCYDCIEKAINDLPQDYPRNTDEPPVCKHEYQTCISVHGGSRRNDTQ